MTAHETSEQYTAQKPRLVLMGEFSAGKSTLTNIILDSQPLPMRVTATRLPPVQISYGAPGAEAVSFEGERTPIALDGLEDVSLEETAMIEVTMEAEALELCDLLDMPGISDPNMPKETWENVISHRDHVIWCTHATQAWRQSEAAIWNILRHQSSGHNLLLITQFDKLRSDRDRMRVRKRIEKETEGLFEAMFPVSLLQALESTDENGFWASSGVEAFSDYLVHLLMHGTAPEMDTPDAATPPAATAQAHPAVSKNHVTPRRVSGNPASSETERLDRGTAGIGF